MTRARYRTHAVGTEAVTLTLADGRYVQYRAIGGYAYVVSLPGRPGTLGPQVCEKLSGTGNTLSVGAGQLARVIQREARRCFRDPEREPAYLRDPQ